MARALGVQSCGELALYTGSLSDEPVRANHAHENPKMPLLLYFFHLSLLLVLKYNRSHQTLGSHSGASACVFVSARLCHYEILQQ